MYRIVNSIIEDGKINEESRARIKAEYAKFGIVDYCNALPPRSKKKHVQVFVYADGRVEEANTRITGEVMRAVNKKSKVS